MDEVPHPIVKAPKAKKYSGGPQENSTPYRTSVSRIDSPIRWNASW